MKRFWRCERCGEYTEVNEKPGLGSTEGQGYLLSVELSTMSGLDYYEERPILEKMPRPIPEMLDVSLCMPCSLLLHSTLAHFLSMPSVLAGPEEPDDPEPDDSADTAASEFDGDVSGITEAEMFEP